MSKKDGFKGDVGLFVIGKDNSSETSIGIEGEIVIKVGWRIEDIDDKLKLLVGDENGESLSC